MRLSIDSIRCLILIAASVLLGPVANVRAATCVESVTTGFSGDLNAVYGSDYGGGGGDSSSGDSGGDAGAGAGEGKVLGGLMTLTRLSDGQVLGSAVTDNVQGLVTIRPCPGDLPALLTLTGQAGAKYFDEGTNQLVDFGPGNVLHALIDSFDENVGVSPITEAAYRYALNNFILNPVDIRAGRAALATSGNVTGLTLTQVRSASTIVLNEVNRLQTTGMRLRSLKSLPTPIDDRSADRSLPDNRYGIAAAVLGGLAVMAKNYVASDPRPALAAGDQLARDLTDGKLDGFGLDGLPASGRATYDAVRLPVAASVGANAIGARFGSTTTLARASDIAERSSMAGGNWAICRGSADTATLLKDGSVTVTRRQCSGDSTALTNFATQVVLIESSGEGTETIEVPRTFVVKRDGTVWGWGETVCGLLGNGETATGYRTTPVQVPGISSVTSIAVGRYFALARDTTGSVYAWGLNYIGELGMGLHNAAPGSVLCTNPYTSGDFRMEYAATTPIRIAALSDIMTVAADRITGYALDRHGALFQWGLIPTGFNFNAPPPYYGEYGTQLVPVRVQGLPAASAIAASYYMTLALAADGTVWGFGPNLGGNFGDGTQNPHLTPAQVPGLANVVEIAGVGQSPFVALLQDGTIRYWGGCCLAVDQSLPAYVLKTPTAPQAGNTPIYSDAAGLSRGTLPPIRHVHASGSRVLLYAIDGSLYEFPKSDYEQVFVLVSLPATPAGSKATAIEYHHAGFDHYFVTDIADEITKLDNGTFAGWTRTGESFMVFADAPAGTAAVCRFFSTSFSPKSSHFYTPDDGECARVRANSNWQLEGVVFHVSLPDLAGNCVNGTKPVYRLYNDGRGAAPNHRYTTSLTTRNAMMAAGWISEGYGALGVIMCASQ